MEGLELICFEIISNVGMARSCFINSIQEAQNGDFTKAEQLIEDGCELFIKGHHSHAKLIQEEANGMLERISLLLIHAEDQLMSAESFKILANELVKICKTNQDLKKQIELINPKK
ncbi:PTS lactose/cellobiose transporter subunit IIA [Breznakia pachnodae]|uniref:PTS system cellobiose-specific IIA component n=1 Tax=Breznakia pachnodae TaxID=265178 RepID=A0ABU0E2Z6_9FIRM|nr:PTS lactose/cellobiose transporter subunit IIA [Breznakia pachnodae]MDQ0361114.1 PTS system cellobiose-specific IIA component [Breznakia pachnodae]